jgi:hypothetical protein
MQEKTNKILLSTLLLLTAATALLLFFQGRNGEALVDKNLFRVEDLKAIDRVELVSTIDTVQLSFNGTRWLVNNNDAADRDMVDVLFATLLQAEPKRPVADNLKDSLIKVLKSSGIKIKLFEKDELMKTFTAGGNATKTQTYFMNEDGNVYVVTIPGYRVYVSGIFEQTESAWRDKYVFAFNWSNFKRLSIQFSANAKNNFEVELTDGYFGIKNLPTDTTKLNNFLDAVSLLTVNEYTNLDTLTEMKPVAAIEVSDIADRKYMLSVFNFSIAGRTACWVKNGQAVWIDNQKLATLLKNRDFFTKMP